MDRNKEISAELTQEQFSFLEDFEKRCKNHSDSSSISKTMLLRCLLRLFEEVNVDVRGVKTEEELLRRSLSALKHARI